MRSRYDALICSSVRSPNRSVARMSSHVRPAAPFIVIPSAIDADSPERKTLGAPSASTARSRSMLNALEADTTASSDPVRARGNASMTAGAGSPSGPVGSPHAARERKTSSAESASGRRVLIVASRDGFETRLTGRNERAGEYVTRRDVRGARVAGHPSRPRAWASTPSLSLAP